MALGVSELMEALPRQGLSVFCVNGFVGHVWVLLYCVAFSLSP